jgi:DME family drug/metabolite transporter
MVALLAIGNSFFFALSFVIVRIEMRRVNPLSALMIIQLWCLVGSSLISLVSVPLNQFVNRAILYFIAAGVIAPFVGRFLLYVGINRVGVSIASPLAQMKALFAIIAAMIMLGESLTPSIGLGTVLIITGAIAISWEQSGGQIERKWSRKDLLFPLMSAACFGAAHVFRKVGLNISPEPIVGVTVQNATSVAVIPLLALAQRGKHRLVLNDTRAWFIFGLAGLFTLVSQLCLFYALDLGQVVIVTPLASLSPLFVLLLVGIFLKKLERVTWKIVLGSILIIGGTTVLTLVSQG